jgi:predicted TIM-barrel fold metal-dependent hydrolase
MNETGPGPIRRIATEEAFTIPEVSGALRDWAAADPGQPDQDFWDFVFTQGIAAEDKRKIYHANAERIFRIPPRDAEGRA